METLLYVAVLMEDEDLFELVLPFAWEKKIPRWFLCQPVIPQTQLASLTPSDALHSMRFTLAEIHDITIEMKLPDMIITRGHSGYKVFSFEAVAILCYRLAFPNRLRSLVAVFGRSSAALSSIVNYMAIYLAHRFRRVLSWDSARIGPQLPAFAAAVHVAGSPLKCVPYFLDGKKVQISRPIRDQRVTYSGHKRIHCESYHALTTPDGIICHIFGPERGRHHDVWLMDRSPLLGHLSLAPFCEYFAYADQGYSPRAQLMVPFKGAVLEPYQRYFNVSMSSVRIAVEWGFGRVSSLWSFTASAKMMASLKSPTGSYFKVAVLLTNIRTCLDEHNQISEKFEECKPPSLREYLARTFIY
jgi:hypothetical protein